MVYFFRSLSLISEKVRKDYLASRKCQLKNNMYRRGKCVVREMCSQINIRSTKCLVGKMSSWGNSRSRKCLVVEMPSGGSVGREIDHLGCVSQGSVGRGNVQSGKCPDSVFNFFNLALEELPEKQTNFVLGLYSQAFLFLCF